MGETDLESMDTGVQGGEYMCYQISGTSLFGYKTTFGKLQIAKWVQY